MSFSRRLAVPSVEASGGFSSPSVHLAQMPFQNEVECRASGSSACAYLHLGAGDASDQPLTSQVFQKTRGSSPPTGRLTVPTRATNPGRRIRFRPGGGTPRNSASRWPPTGPHATRPLASTRRSPRSLPLRRRPGQHYPCRPPSRWPQGPGSWPPERCRSVSPGQP